MCGIVGLVGKDICHKSKEIFTDMLKFDTIRGTHSTGVMSVTSGNTVSSFKKAVDGYTFTDLGRYERFMRTAWSSRLLLGHNRHATVYSTINDTNSHPFNRGSTHLVHNGSLKSWNNLHDATETYVDSEAICFQIEKTGIIDTVSKLNGAFTLAHYDEDSCEFNIIRNNERPMWLAKIKDKDITVFASEPGFITAAVARRGFELERDPWCLKVGNLLSFKLDDKEDIGSYYLTAGVELYKPTYQQGVDTRKKAYTLTHLPKTTTGKGTTGGGDKEANKQMKIEKLRSAGLEVGQELVGQGSSFYYYVNQDNLEGKGLGRMYFLICSPEDPHSNLRVVLYAVSKKDADALKNKLCSLRVVTMTRVDIGDSKSVEMPMVTYGKVLDDEEEQRFWDKFDWDGNLNDTVEGEVVDKSVRDIAGEDDAMRASIAKSKEDLYDYAMKQEVLANRKRLEEHSEIPDEDDDSVCYDSRKYFVEGIPCTEARFKVKTKNGCCVCGDPISLGDHEEILWTVGEPLCLECSNDISYQSLETKKTTQEILDNLRS